MQTMKYANTTVDVTNSNYTTMLWCYIRDNLWFIHSYCSRRYT